VHNDYLQFAFEYGIGAIALLPLLIAATGRVSAILRPVYISFLTLAGFYFPLETPLTAFVGAMVLGNILARDGDALRSRKHWRSDLVYWLPQQPARFDPTWGEAIPATPRTSER
jgi:hypothetical protein